MCTMQELRNMIQQNTENIDKLERDMDRRIKFVEKRQNDQQQEFIDLRTAQGNLLRLIETQVDANLSWLSTINKKQDQTLDLLSKLECVRKGVCNVETDSSDSDKED